VRNALAILLTIMLLVGCASKPRAPTQSALPPPDPAPLVCAHAHNDYQHARPLYEALDNGFCSIEADIVLIDGELRVGHSVFLTEPGRTLQSLYLDPLHERVRSRSGRVYRDGPGVILLNVPEVYPRLLQALQPYADMLTTWQDGRVHPGAVTIALTGSHPPASVLMKETTRYVAIDGGARDIDRDVPPDILPQISLPWKSQVAWDGEGEMPAAERLKLRKLVERVHAHGRALRLWDAPDHPAAWEELVDAGVDYINTDDLPRLRAYLLSRATTRPLTKPDTRKAPAGFPPDPGGK
jgi:hypothetical protein